MVDDAPQINGVHFITYQAEDGMTQGWLIGR